MKRIKTPIKNILAVAKESLKLSIEADNKDYVKMNKESISEWTNKL